MVIVKSKLLKQLSDNYPNFLKRDLSKFTDIILKEIKRALKRGDRVITKSGMHGKVMELNDKDGSCVIETLAGKIKMEKSSLSRIKPPLKETVTGDIAEVSGIYIILLV